MLTLTYPRVVGMVDFDGSVLSLYSHYPLQTTLFPISCPSRSPRDDDLGHDLSRAFFLIQYQAAANPCSHSLPATVYGYSMFYLPLGLIKWDQPLHK